MKGLVAMYKIEVSGIEQTTISLKKFSTKLSKAREKALYSAGKDTVQRVRFFIETGGLGTWKPPHPVTVKFTKSGSLWRKEERPGNFYGLGKFSRFVVSKSKFITGFGVNTTGGKFSKPLMGYAKYLSGGKTIVTPSMRKKFGVVGFPLKKTTTKLIIPRRLIRFDVDRMTGIFTKALEKNLDSKTV